MTEIQPSMPPGDAPPAPARPRRRRGRRAVAALLLAAFALTGGALWLTRTASGAAWALAQVPGLQARGVQGSLLGGELAIERLQLALNSDRLTVDALRATGVTLQPRWSRRAGEPLLALQLVTLEAQRARWQTGPASGPTSPPTGLRLPLAVDAPAIRLAALQLDTLPPLQDVQAAIALGSDGGAHHRLQRLSWRSARLQAELQGTIGADAPVPVELRATLHSVDGAATPWDARVDLQGPLTRLAVRAHLAGHRGGAGAPALDAEATLTPFAAWPLAALRLHTQDLDLNALHADAPHTRLRGQARIDTQGLAADAQAEATLDNTLAGRWDQGRLPLRHLHLRVQGQPQSMSQLSLPALALELGGDQAAGRLQGEGRWLPADGGQTLQLSLLLDGLRPALIDQRLPAMSLSGPLTLQVDGLPAVAGGTADTAAGAPSSPPPRPPLAWRAAVRATLDGRLEPPRSPAAAPPVRLALDAVLRRDGLLLREARASAGEASASATAQLGFGTGGWPLQWQAHAELKDFDPLTWWPGLGGTDAARRAPTRLNALLDGTGRVTEPARLDGWAGRLDATLAPSQWAGVPLQGRFAARREAGAPGQWQAEASAGGNRLVLTAREPSRADGREGELALTLDAPVLAALAPLWPALPASLGAENWPRSGTLQGRASARWALPGGDAPAAIDWQGEWHARQLAHPAWRAERLDAEAQGRDLGQDALTLDLQGAGWSHGAARVDQLRLALRGGLREHTLELEADSPVRPPAWAEQLVGAHGASGSRLALAARGRWSPTADGGPLGAGRWEGRFAHLRGQARDSTGQPWLAAQDIVLHLAWDDETRLTEARIEPGRIELPGTALRWTEARWQPGAAGAPPQFGLQAQLEPFALAPLLARAQPELGWRGDLVLAGDIALQAGARFNADIVFERRGGDLSVADDVHDASSPRRALDLTDLRLGLSAHDGTWHFTAGLAGRQLGEMAGVVTAHTGAAARWPTDDAPLDGVFQLHVAQLSAWGAWVPPGWRLGGALQSAATLGGRWGAPAFSGRLVGHRLEVRHALQGVQLSDGEIALSLQGDRARVDHFEWRGGEGRLAMSGEATLGREPVAHLQMTAERLRVLGRLDRRLVVSGRAELALRPDAATLTGRLRVDEGLVDFSRGDAPTLDDDVRVVGAPGGTGSNGPEAAQGNEAEAPRPFASTLDVALDLGPTLRVKGRGLDTSLTGSLRITNPNHRLAVRGEVSAERGTYAAYAQKLSIERGRLSFVGPVDDPRLDILAVRPNLDVSVGVAVTGSALNPRVKLYSEPEMSDTDKLSWLMLGRAPDGLGRADTALLQRAALALLAGEGETPTDAFLANIGLSDFGVRQTGEGSSQTTTVSIGKQLSRRWYLGYERSVNATAGTWQLIYRVAQRFTLRAQSGADSALDAIWTWRWD